MLIICADCGHTVGMAYVAMTDECPRCKTAPFNEKEQD